jgi:MFS family permease
LDDGGEAGMAVISQFRELPKDSRNAFISALLGWTMDAFDYFIVVLVYADIAKDFGVSLTKMAFLTTVTLLMRPVGALLFGIWADRIGRRTPLIVDLLLDRRLRLRIRAQLRRAAGPAAALRHRHGR